MIEYITTNWEQILLILTSVVTAASTISALTPTTKDDAVVSKLKKVVDFLAINFGHAKNKDQ